MRPDPARRGPRERVLFLSFVYPCMGGSGSQIRAASLLRALAASCDVYLLVVGYEEVVSGPPDEEVDRICIEKMSLRVTTPPGTAAALKVLNADAERVAMPVEHCAAGEAGGRILDFYHRHALDRLFVFRFDALHFIHNVLAQFPVKDLDLDELPSRSRAQIAELKGGDQSKDRGKAAMKLMERTYPRRFDRVFVSSRHEAEIVRRETGLENPLVLPNVFPLLTRPVAEPARDNEILFVGSFFYYPNVDAVLYFCREMLPRIEEMRKCDVTFRIVGMGGTEALESIRNRNGVELAGYQKDLAPFYARAAVVVVPLRAGAGTRLKILEAFAHGRPVVSTSKGAEGLDVTDGLDLLLADDPEGFASACVKVMHDREAAQALCEGAARLHHERYSPGALADAWRNINEDRAP